MEKLMTVRELMDYLNVPRVTVYYLIKKGMPAIKIGRRMIRFKKEDVDTWLGSYKTTSK